MLQGVTSVQNNVNVKAEYTCGDIIDIVYVLSVCICVCVCTCVCVRVCAFVCVRNKRFSK